MNGRRILLGRSTAIVHRQVSTLFGDLAAVLGASLVGSGKHFSRRRLQTIFTRRNVSIHSTGHFVNSLLRDHARRNHDMDCVDDIGGGSSGRLSFAIAGNFSLLLSHCRGLFDRHVINDGKSHLIFCYAPFSSLGVLLGLLSVLSYLSFDIRNNNAPYMFIHFGSPRALRRLTLNSSCHGLVLSAGKRVFRRRVSLFSFFFKASGLASRRH